MKNNNVTIDINIDTFCYFLTIIFIILKVIGVINWSWLWILSPIWIFFGLFIVLVIIASIKYWLFDRRKI